MGLGTGRGSTMMLAEAREGAPQGQQDRCGLKHVGTGIFCTLINPPVEHVAGQQLPLG